MPKITFFPDYTPTGDIKCLEHRLNAEPFEPFILWAKDEAAYVIFDPAAVTDLKPQPPFGWTPNSWFRRSREEQHYYKLTPIEYRMIALSNLEFDWTAHQTWDFDEHPPEVAQARIEKAEARFRSQLEVWAINDEQYQQWWKDFLISHPSINKNAAAP